MQLVGMLDSPYVRRVAISMKLTGFALAACDKGVSLVCEREQGPAEKRHEPWHARSLGQVLAAFAVLEDAARRASPWLQGTGLSAADVVVAVAWRFNQHYHAELVPAWKFPALAKFSTNAQALQAFESTPLGPPAP